MVLLGCEDCPDGKYNRKASVWAQRHREEKANIGKTTVSGDLVGYFDQDESGPRCTALDFSTFFKQQWRLQMQFAPFFNLFLLTVEPDGIYFLMFFAD